MNFITYLAAQLQDARLGLSPPYPTLVLAWGIAVVGLLSGGILAHAGAALLDGAGAARGIACQFLITLGVALSMCAAVVAVYLGWEVARTLWAAGSILPACLMVLPMQAGLNGAVIGMLPVVDNPATAKPAQRGRR